MNGIMDPILAIRDLRLAYGAAEILRGIDLAAAPAAITCVLGRNGVGKTSLMRAITGQHPVRGGQVSLQNKDITRARPDARARAGLAYVPQGREIFPMLTVRENLETGLATAGTKTVPGHIFELFPILGQMLHRRGGDLSGGQQQQLAIGRALVTNPKLIVLDEPTEGIQPSIIQDIALALARLRDEFGLSILLVEQYLDFAREIADAIHIMDRGRIVHSGSPSTLDRVEVRDLLTV